MQRGMSAIVNPAAMRSVYSMGMGEVCASIVLVKYPDSQADRLLHHYHCWGLDLEGQGYSPEGTQSSANIIDSFVECILAAVSQLDCRGVIWPLVFPVSHMQALSAREIAGCCPLAGSHAAKHHRCWD